jgi:hypothetical protein
MTPALIHYTYMTYLYDVLFIPPPLSCTTSSAPIRIVNTSNQLTWTAASTSSAPSLGARKTHQTHPTAPSCRKRGVRWYHLQQCSHRRNIIVDLRAFPLQPLCHRSRLPEPPLPQCRHPRHSTQETGAFPLRQPYHHSRLPELPFSR